MLDWDGIAVACFQLDGYIDQRFNRLPPGEYRLRLKQYLVWAQVPLETVMRTGAAIEQGSEAQEEDFLPLRDALLLVRPPTVLREGREEYPYLLPEFQPYAAVRILLREALLLARLLGQTTL